MGARRAGRPPRPQVGAAADEESEKSVQERRFVIAVGQVSGPSGYNTIFCGIRDISKDGVRIEVPDEYVFPRELTFKRIAMGEVQKARVAWRRRRLAELQLTETGAQ
jgi:hypothetical protein